MQNGGKSKVGKMCRCVIYPKMLMEMGNEAIYQEICLMLSIKHL